MTVFGSPITNNDGRTLTIQADGAHVYLQITDPQSATISFHLINPGAAVVANQNMAQTILNNIRSAIQSMFPTVS
jgi:hypothetical protein